MDGLSRRFPLMDVFGAGQAIGGAASAAGSIGAAALAANASKYASQQQYNAEQQALGQQQGMFNTQQSNIAPYLGAGTTALGQLTTGTQPGGQYATPQRIPPPFRRPALPRTR